MLEQIVAVRTVDRRLRVPPFPKTHADPVINNSHKSVILIGV
jgi:hypothetical protein